MSVHQVNRLCKAIQEQFITTGSIDPNIKELLLAEMGNFDGGNEFIPEINAAFDEFECYTTNAQAERKTTNLKREKLRQVFARIFNRILEILNRFQSCNIEQHETTVWQIYEGNKILGNF